MPPASSQPIPSEQQHPALRGAPYRIAVADENAAMREYYQEALARLGHEIVAAQGGRQLVELCRVARPDLIITEVHMADLDGIEAAAEICRERPRPVILASTQHDAALVHRVGDLEVQGYLIKPVKQAELAIAIGLAMVRFAKLQAVRQEAEELRQALADRKLIERAKGVVCKRTGADEEAAFRRMRKLASIQNIKLVETARLILSAEEMFKLLEEGTVGGQRATTGDPTNHPKGVRTR